MKWFSYVIAAIVSAVIYMVIMERDAVMRFAGVESATASQPAPEPPAAPQKAAETDHRVSVVALKSSAQVIDSAVILRGRTEALRQVTVMAETAGAVISEPLRKGSLVEAGEILCQLDMGIRDASLSEAQAVSALRERLRP